MQINTLEYKKIDEIMYEYEHSSGLKAYVVPKKGYSKQYAAFATHYGSINNAFVSPGDSEITEVPDGIAHFLEHKLFEQEDGSVMDKFSALGSSPNAYTSFSQTVYLFASAGKFHENFKLLLDFVQNPYITSESVEREKGIIGQEIRMYEDDATWRVFFNLLRGLYEKNPVRIDIAGTVESISKIDRENLYKCYNTFYHPSNMVILVTGDVDHKKVFEQVESSIKLIQSKPEINRIFAEEPAKVNMPYTEQSMAVAVPLFQLGFKDSGAKAKGFDSLMREIAVKILLEMIVGRSSKLYNDLYSEGLINSSFDFDFTIEENYAFSMLGGESKDPHQVRDRIVEEIKRLGTNGLNKENYERIKRAINGRFIRYLNSVERISHMFIPVYFRDANLFDYFDVYDKITFEYSKEVFNDHFNPDNIALSVIKPL
ncbi:MAG: insulinase family protein [Clostridia bacterium]|nr:insulinase family protein [Clostridia bacterium]